MKWLTQIKCENAGSLPQSGKNVLYILVILVWIKRGLRDELRRDDKLRAVMTATKLAFNQLPQKVVSGFFSDVQKNEQRYTELDGVLLNNPVRPLVIDVENFDEDGDSEDEIEVNVVECDDDESME